MTKSKSLILKKYKEDNTMTSLFKDWNDNELKNAIWISAGCHSVPRGGYPEEWYRDEIERRTGSRLGYHEEGENT